jgi:hypothetical protein
LAEGFKKSQGIKPSTSVRVLTNRKVINENPCDYLYSSANFYMEGGKLFSFLKDLRNEF